MCPFFPGFFRMRGELHGAARGRVPMRRGRFEGVTSMEETGSGLKMPSNLMFI